MSLLEYEKDLHAELGYRTAGRREVSQREWFSLRGNHDEVAPNPKAFKKLVARLRVKKWVSENPEKRRTIANRYAAKSGVIARITELSRKRARDKFRAAGLVVTCEECGSRFCPIFPQRGNRPRRFCDINCTARAWQRARRRVAGAKETGCRNCMEQGHNARRCAGGATSARGAG